MLQIIFILFCGIAFIGMFIYQIVNTEKSLLFGRRWQYENKDLKPSKEAIEITRFMSIAGIIITVIVTFLTVLGIAN